MTLSDMIRKRQGGSSVSRGSGLSGMVSRYAGSSTDRNEELQTRIDNASERLTRSGFEVPQPEDHKGLFQRLLDGLNYLNNKKNQGLWWATHGGSVYDVPEQVEGRDLLQDWAGGDFKGSGVAGFGFDLVTDPLNLLSFGTAGAATQAAKGGAKALEAGTKGLKLLGDGSQAAAKVGSSSNPIFARLGGHLPFTNVGGYVNIPGSDKVIGALGSTVRGATSGLTRFIDDKLPNVAKVGRATRDLLGSNFIRGYGIPAEVNQITQRTADLIRMDNKDIVDNLVTQRRVWESWGYKPGEDDLGIIKAVEDPDFDDITPTQRLIAEGLRDFFDMHYLKAKEAGVIEDFTANYFPHIFKGKKAEVEAALEQMRRRGARLSTTSGFAKHRILDMPLSQILQDPELANKLKPETDIIKIMGVYKTSLEKAIRNNDMLTELTSLGPDIIMKENREILDAATNQYQTIRNDIPVGWVKAPVSQLKGYWVPPEIANHLKNVMEPFINNTSFNKMMKVYDGILGWWKGMATVPNPGFHIRNQLGNVFNNYLAGVRSLDNYKMAWDAQRADDTTIDFFYDLIRYFDTRPYWAVGEGVSGLPSTDIMRTLGPGSSTSIDPRAHFMERLFNSNRLRARFFEGDGPKLKIKWGQYDGDMNMTGVKFLAKLYGVTGLGFFSGDLGEDILKRLDPVSKAQKFNPLSTKSVPFKALESFGSTLEDNARLAHFISKIKDGMTIEDAAESVKKYLFDYTRLTPTEKNFGKRLMPFYAFTRNNLPLQIRELIKQPKYASILASFQNNMDIWAEDETGLEVDRSDLPKYLTNLYSVRLPFQTSGRDVFLGVDLPIRDVNSFDFGEVMSMITPLISVPYEQLANRNFYTGRDLESYQGQTVRAPGYIQGAFRAAQALAGDDPAAQTFQTFFGLIGGTVAIDETTGANELRIPPRWAHILNQLVAAKNVGKLSDFITGDSYDPFNVASVIGGVSAVSSTAQDRRTNSQYEQLRALEDLLRKISSEGPSVPTLQELNQRGQGGGLLDLLGR